jgi:hypothetical protein
VIFGGDWHGSRRGLDVQLRIGSFVSCCNFGGGCLRTSLGVEFVLRSLLTVSSSRLILKILPSIKVRYA